MAISKASIAAGILGSGGGAVGTVAVVKYVASKESNTSLSNSETLNKVEESVSNQTKEETLDTIKNNITSWGNTNGGCKIKVKLTSDSEEVKELNGFVEANKADLKGLDSFLKDSSKNSKAKTPCDEAAKANGNKYMIATKGNSADDWTFAKEQT